MSEWQKITLQEVVSKLGDGLHGTPKYDDSGEYYFINGNNLVNGKIAIKESTQKVTYEEYSKYKKELNDRTILLGINGTIGNFALYNDEKCVLGKSACYFNVINEVDKHFIKYVIADKTFQSYIENFANGTTIKNVSLKTVREYEFLLPPLPEQKLISETLSSLDDKIDLLHRQNKTLEALAETLFRQRFVEEAEESWEKKKISEVASINFRTISKNFSHSEIEYLDTGSITEGNIESFQNYLTKDAPSRAQRIVIENDIVYSVVRPIQRHYGLLHDVKTNTIVSTGFAVISCDKISPHFIYTLLTQNETIEFLDMVAEGSTSAYPSLKPSDIADFEFQLPSKEKLKAFHAIADNNWKKIKSNTNQIKTLTQLRDTLLPKLMSGEVRVKN